LVQHVVENNRSESFKGQNITKLLPRNSIKQACQHVLANVLSFR